MAAKLLPVLQHGSVELTVTAENVSNEKRVIQAGIKVENTRSASQEVLKEIQAARTAYFDSITTPEPLVENDPRYKILSAKDIEKIKNWVQPTLAELEEIQKDYYSTLVKRFVYLKNIDYIYEDDLGKVISLKIKDTRNISEELIPAKVYEGFASPMEHWLYAHLDTSPWYSPLENTVLDALVNANIEKDLKTSK